MGTFLVEIEVGSPDAQRWLAVDALVDTGASQCSLPGSLLRELGLYPTRRKEYRFAQGESRVMGVGQTYIRLMGEEFITDFIFNEEGTMPLLGALALENAQLAVDPYAMRLIPRPGILL